MLVRQPKRAVLRFGVLYLRPVRSQCGTLVGTGPNKRGRFWFVLGWILRAGTTGHCLLANCLGTSMAF